MLFEIFCFIMACVLAGFLVFDSEDPMDTVLRRIVWTLSLIGFIIAINHIRN